MSPETCLGKMNLKNENGEEISDKFIDCYISKDYVNIGNKFLGLPNGDEWINIVKDSLKNNKKKKLEV